MGNVCTRLHHCCLSHDTVLSLQNACVHTSFQHHCCVCLLFSPHRCQQPDCGPAMHAMYPQTGKQVSHAVVLLKLFTCRNQPALCLLIDTLQTVLVYKHHTHTCKQQRLLFVMACMLMLSCTKHVGCTVLITSIEHRHDGIAIVCLCVLSSAPYIVSNR